MDLENFELLDQVTCKFGGERTACWMMIEVGGGEDECSEMRSGRTTEEGEAGRV